MKFFKFILKNYFYALLTLLIVFGGLLWFRPESAIELLEVSTPLSVLMRIWVILIINLLWSITFILYDFDDRKYKASCIKWLNNIDTGNISISKLSTLNGDYEAIRELYYKEGMYKILHTCIKLTKINGKIIPLNHIKRKLEYFKMYNRLNSMLSVMINHDKEAYHSWVVLKEDIDV